MRLASMKEATMADSGGTNEIYERPGFKIRRCHQIATSIFHEECGDLDLTTTQFGTLVMLQHNPGIDQIALSRLLGLDRSTTASVLALLEKRALVLRRTARHDRRRRELFLTGKAMQLIEHGASAMERARVRLLSPLEPAEQEAFLSALDKLLDAFNSVSRAPLIGAESARTAADGPATAKA
jgi:DNA-binding MarR family transcriptional regulator